MKKTKVDIAPICFGNPDLANPRNDDLNWDPRDELGKVRT